MDFHDLAKDGPLYVFLTHYALKQISRWLKARRIVVTIEQKEEKDERKDTEGR